MFKRMKYLYLLLVFILPACSIVGMDSANGKREYDKCKSIDQCLTYIERTISKNWKAPKHSTKHQSAVIRFILNPDGTLQQAVLSESSGNLDYDKSGFDALTKSAPFKEIARFNIDAYNENFKKLRFVFSRYNEK